MLVSDSVQGMKQSNQTVTKRTARTRIWIWAGGIGVTIVALCAVLWVRRFHDYTPVEAVKDLKAGFAARHAPIPARKFLELRYGPQSEAANRNAAFLDLFNSGHIEGLYLIVGNRSDHHTRKGIEQVAQILRDHRRDMTADEKKTLADYFNSESGKAQVQAATASYQSKDARFRAVAAPVIQELMTTLAALQSN